MKLMDIDADTLGIPDTEYDARVTMQSTEFSRICRDLSMLGESVRIEVSKEGVRFASDGEAANGSVLLKQTEAARRKYADYGKEDEDETKKEEDDDDDDVEEGSSKKKTRVKKLGVKIKKEAGEDDEDAEMKNADDDEEENAEGEFKAKSDDEGEEEKEDEEDEDGEEARNKKKRKKAPVKV